MLVVSVTFKVNREKGSLGLHLLVSMVLVGHFADGDVRGGELITGLRVVFLQGRVQCVYLANALVVSVRLIFCYIHFTGNCVVLVSTAYLIILIQSFFIFVVD